MARGTLPLGLLLSCLLHGGLALFVWSLYAGGRHLSAGIVEVFPAGESRPESGASRVPQGSRGGASGLRAAEPRPAAVPSSVSLPAQPPPAQATRGPAPEPAAPVSLRAGSNDVEPSPGPGVAGRSGELVNAGASVGAAAGPSTLPGGGYQLLPAYPEGARLSGAEGTTSLRIRVLEDGSVGEVIVARSAGHPGLDQAAVDAVQRWRFEPARRGGRPVAVRVSLPVRFRLE
ncbi:MAG: energy transducer TonB [Candidatus Rokubacteria bacterium]|nr:energy transducer TonB [Candidatus Rokubacteria bacterium]